MMGKHCGRGLTQALLLLIILACWAWIGPAWASAQTGLAKETPLTQADVDGYIYLLPLLASGPAPDAATGAQWLKEAGFSRSRAAYVSAKIIIAQGLASGLLNASQLADENVPLSLQPSTEEIKLIERNLVSLSKAQQAAQQRAGQTPGATKPGAGS